jgi:soluble lytic murein transglycosylase-like protein
MGFVAAGGPGSLVELDARFARSRRRAALRRARLRRPTLRKRLRRPLLAASIVAAASLAVVGGSGGFAGVRGSTPAKAGAEGPLCPVPAAMRPSFVSASRVTGVPLPLLAAVATVESRMDQRAQSEAGALGVLQVMPATAAELGLDPNRVDTNVLAGARYLERMLERYGSTDLALAAYNAGPTALDLAGGVAPTRETQTYVANVQARWQALAGCR